MAYSKEDLCNAMEEYGTGASMGATARKYGIPRSSLHDHISGKHKQVGKGGPTVLRRVVQQVHYTASANLDGWIPQTSSPGS